MLLKASGSYISQKEIASEIYKPGWGTDEPEMKSYLRKHFSEVRSKQNCNLKQLNQLIDNGYLVIVYWLNSLPTQKGEEDIDGHYSVLSKIDLKNKKVQLMDPSRQKRLYGRNRIYWLSQKDFIKRWTVKEKNKVVSHKWALWVKPSS